MTALDLAKDFEHYQVASLLLSHGKIFDSQLGKKISGPDAPSYRHGVVGRFYSHYSPEHTNLDLVMELLDVLCLYSTPGAILVYLSGYREVMELRKMIWNHPMNSRFSLHVLHRQLGVDEYNKIFVADAEGKRPVILSTGFAETSVSFGDVFCVIDSGLVRDQETEVVVMARSLTRWISKVSLDSLLYCVWIKTFSFSFSFSFSKESALQRSKKQLVKDGFVLRLYPRWRMQLLRDYHVPEILHSSLVDVCLYARLLIPSDMELKPFFNSLPTAPSTVFLCEAIEILKAMDAFSDELQVRLWGSVFYQLSMACFLFFYQVTDIGRRLTELHIDPRYGKMIFVALGLKCLDPVLTIVSWLSCDDAFIVPASSEERSRALIKRYSLVPDNYSDHLALLRAYQLWDQSFHSGTQQQVAICLN